jgi:hypothetical protein
MQAASGIWDLQNFPRMAENRFDARLDGLLKTTENEFKDHAQTP